MWKCKTTLFRYLGGILLVTGTTVGAGMLALPVVTASSGFVPSVVMFVLCYLVMLLSAFFFLEVNLSIKDEVNLISMADRTLGVVGKVISWVFYLLLLYSLMAAYLAASAPIFLNFFQDFLHIPNIPSYLGPFFLPVIFGWFVYLGTSGVDWINKFLMFALGISYALMIILIPSHIEIDLLKHVDWGATKATLPIIITSFGYHIIIPSLATYMEHDEKHLKWTLITGSIIPLVIYLLWQAMVLGVVPLELLQSAFIKGQSSAAPLAKEIPSNLLTVGVQLFSFFAIITSFLGVSLSLADFLTDGLKLKASWEGRLIAILLTFVPPVVFVFTSSKGFVLALEYAGICVAVLLIIIPSLMSLYVKTKNKVLRNLKYIGVCCCILFALAIIALDVAKHLKN